MGSTKKKHVVARCPVCRQPFACYQRTRTSGIELRPFHHVVLSEDRPMAPGLACKGATEWKPKSELEIVEEPE